MTRADDLIEATFPLADITPTYGQYRAASPTRDDLFGDHPSDDAWAQRPRHHVVTRPTATTSRATAPTPVAAPTTPARFDAINHGAPVLNAPARGTALKMTPAQADIIAWALNNSGIIERGGAHHQATVTQLRAMERRGFVTLSYGSVPNSPAYGTVTSLGERISRETIAKRAA